MGRLLRIALLLTVIGGVAHADVEGELAAIPKTAPGCDQARAHCCGIQLHVAANEQGLVVSTEWLVAELAAAQRHFAPLDVGFGVVGVDALPASAAHLVTRSDRDALAVGRLGGRVIHVFITGLLDDVDEKGQIAYGVTWRRGDRKYLIVSGQALPRTLAHEMGHFFGLQHSSYAISIMNKAERKEPPMAERTFADEEIAAMRPALAHLVRDKTIAELPR